MGEHLPIEVDRPLRYPAIDFKPGLWQGELHGAGQTDIALHESRVRGGHCFAGIRPTHFDASTGKETATHLFGTTGTAWKWHI